MERLFIPSFTYSIIKTIYLIIKSKSKIGQFSEDFRKIFLPERSNDPIFSVCAYGKNLKL